MTQLYKLRDDFLQAMSDMRNSDFDEETIKDTLEGMSGEIEDKLKNMAYFVVNSEADLSAIDSEIARLNKRKSSLSNSIDRIKGWMLLTVKETGVTVQDPVLPVKTAKLPPSLRVINEKLVPKKFWVSKPKPAPTIDKRALLAAVKEAADKDKTVNGCELVTDGVRLKIG